MQYQTEKGIYIYSLQPTYVTDSASTEIRHVFYKTLEHFFWIYSEYSIKKHIGHSIYDIKCTHVVDYVYGSGQRYIKYDINCNTVNCTKHSDTGNRFTTVFDENGKQYLPDVLIGMRRAWLKDKKASKDYRNRYNRRSNGRRKQVFGRYRHMQTLQERKWAEAWDDVEFAPKTRRARLNHNLPDAWDDWHVHNDKSWKTQSKRKHQWKQNENYYN